MNAPLPIRIPGEPVPSGDNSAGYSLKPIYGLPTREIIKGEACVGLLYAPNARRPGWEIYPVIGRHDLTDGVPSYAAIEFASEAAALSFLGIAESRS